MKARAVPAAPLLLVVLTGAFLMFFALAAFFGGNWYVACASLLLLPVASALATFRCAVSPLLVAASISAPLAVPAALIGNLVWAGLLAAVFVLCALTGYFGRYRREAQDASRAHA